MKLAAMLFFVFLLGSPALADPAKDQALLNAIKKGSLPEVKAAISKGASANAANKNRTSALSKAIEIKHADIVSFLLSKGAKPELAGGTGFTPLHNAAGFYSDPKILQIILRSSKNLEVKNDYGRTPLFEAVSNNKSFAVDQLLKAGANASIEDKKGDNLLLEALKNEKIDSKILASLIKAGAKPNQKNGNGPELLRLAAGNNQIEAVKYLLKLKVDPNAKKNGSPLHSAANNGHLAIIQLLVASGATVDIKDDGASGITPLYWAAMKGDPAPIKFLLSKGANPNILSSDGKSILTVIYPTKIEAIRILLESGAKPTGKDSWGSPLLVNAVKADSLEAVKLLLKHGANKKEKDKDGKTALMHAKTPQMRKLLQ